MSRWTAPSRPPAGPSTAPTSTRRACCYGALLTSPHAHARVTTIDTSAAEKMTRRDGGARDLARRHGDPVGRHGDRRGGRRHRWKSPRDAVRKIKVEYEVLPHLVREDDLAKAGSRAKPGRRDRPATRTRPSRKPMWSSRAYYGIPVITHCCLEPHGQVIALEGRQGRTTGLPRRRSPASPANSAQALEVPATNIHVHQDHIGGGFGSKFSADRWGVECAHLSKKAAAGRSSCSWTAPRSWRSRATVPRPSPRSSWRPRRTAPSPPGSRESWATGGISGRRHSPPIPYVFTNIPNKRVNHTRRRRSTTAPRGPGARPTTSRPPT